MQIFLQAVVYDRNPTTYPFYPPSIVEAERTNGTMLDFLLTTYALNSLFYVAHQQNLLNLVSTPSTLSPATAELLRLSCSTNNSNCVGRVFSSTKFGPKAYVSISMNTTESPKAAFNYSEAYWIGKGRAEMTVIDESKKTLLFTANASCISSSLYPRVYKNT